MSHVVAIANHKGGVGKTTTAVNLGASLAAAEKRVLVIDLDAQGNATSGLGVRSDATRASLYGVLMDLVTLGAAIRRSVHLKGLDVIPATRDLAGAEVELTALPDRAFRLRRALDGYRELYDFVLIDCPPAVGLLTVNALAAADRVLVPLQPEFFALQGLASFSELVQTVRERMNPRLGAPSVLLTLYDARLRLAREVVSEARRAVGDRVMRTRVPRNVTLAEAPGFGRPALVYDIASPGAQAYLALAQEIIASAAAAAGEAARAGPEVSERRWAASPARGSRPMPVRHLA